MPDDAQWMLQSGMPLMLGAGAIMAMTSGHHCSYVDESENVRLRRSTRAFFGVGAVMTVAALVRHLVSGGSDQPRRITPGGRAALHMLLALANAGMSFSMLFGANAGAILCNS